MAVQFIGPSGNIQEVNAGKASFATTYGADGSLMTPGVTLTFQQGFNGGISAAAVPAAGSVIWAMRQGAAATLRAIVRKIRVNMLTVVAATAAQMVDLELLRYAAADITGGTSILAANIGRKHTGSANPQIAHFNHSTNMAALTTTGVTFGQSIAFITHSSAALARNEVIFEWDAWEGPIVLRAGEGLCLRVTTAIGAGMTWGVKGSVQWDEGATVAA